jgi:hypothetical protein
VLLHKCGCEGERKGACKGNEMPIICQEKRNNSEFVVCVVTDLQMSLKEP